MRSREAFALLRAANPVPVMPAARRHWRALKIGLAVVALTVCFLLVAPAVGIRIPVLDFWSAEKAPPKIVQDFEELSQGAPPGMDPGTIPGEARKVALADGTTLWVAPTRYGGFCTSGTTSGGCDKLGTWPLGVSWGATGPIRGLEKGRMRGPLPMTAFDFLEGHANSRYVDSVEIRFADGEVDRPNLAWVSEPIHEGFFIYRVPLEHRRLGHEIRAVVGLDAEGLVVVEATRPTLPDVKQISPEAVVSERQEQARIPTRSGEAVIWEAPTRYEGRCVWLVHQGLVLRLLPCMAKGYAYGLFDVRFVPTADDVLVAGWVAKRYASVEIQFADGTSMIVKPRAGFLLAEVPARNLTRGREATAIIGRDESGKELPPRISVKAAFALAPCFGPLPDPSCP